MPARAAALCTRLLHTGKTCAQPALRGERLCRFHNDARSRAIAEHERMYALSDQLDAMTIPQFLETVHDMLYNIRSVVRAFGEAKLAVIVAVQRLAELTAEGHHRSPAQHLGAVSGQNPNRINDAPATHAKSTTTPQLRAAQ